MTVSDPRHRQAFYAPSQGASELDREEINFGAILATLWRGKWIIALIGALVTTIGGYYAIGIATPVYRASSVIILEPNQEQIVDLQSVAAGLSGDTSEINSELEVLRSRGLMGKVVQELNLISDPEFNRSLAPANWLTRVKHLFLLRPDSNPAKTDLRRAEDRVVSALLSQVSVSNIRASLVFRITASSTDPEKSAGIADAIAEAYVADQVTVKREATREATAWLSAQVEELEQTLQDAESKVANFNANTELISTNALRLLERQAKELRERIVAAADAKTKLTAAVNHETAELTEKQQDLTRINRQLASLRASEQDLMRQISAQNQDLITLQQLTREAEASRVLYEYFLARFNETAAQQGIQQADSRILSRAVIPLRSSEPRTLRILTLSGLAGLVLGALIVLLRERLRNSFQTLQDIEATTGYPVLGQVPALAIRTRPKLLASLIENQTSAAAEAIRNLRTSLLLSDPDHPPQVLVSTSAMPGEGKTTHALALAHSLSGLNRRVLLLGADIRASTLPEYFRELPETDLVSVLLNQACLEDAIYHPRELEIDVLSGASSMHNAPDLFATDAFANLIETLRDRYDHIVIDTPPVLAVPDARLIARSADAILFTVHWNKTSQAQVNEALRLLHSAGQRITGLVFARVSPGALRPYGYGAYSKYAGAV
ncbi:polysaccharide biosynthesis tyrosine autokinase [Roseovarius rhodophyticola]|uniref:non-specific protein-tyrosine kinase n=1 Tax=Roseovarius rhodophyticola TaxID=3080827 RepID=A0ABZ2TJH6_9RHOB|nr:polysaccharide biosynthesis tyrosine autokinase [Roseovarius sp. W115]MDV2930207.1 polysaccharide biosynthesis tyrosine autokinase [Roseovarius sp. W115]